MSPKESAASTPTGQTRRESSIIDPRLAFEPVSPGTREKSTSSSARPESSTPGRRLIRATLSDVPREGTEYSDDDNRAPDSVAKASEAATHTSSPSKGYRESIPKFVPSTSFFDSDSGSEDLAPRTSSSDRLRKRKPRPVSTQSSSASFQEVQTFLQRSNFKSETAAEEALRARISGLLDEGADQPSVSPASEKRYSGPLNSYFDDDS